jgi:hypothetical protein
LKKRLTNKNKSAIIKVQRTEVEKMEKFEIHTTVVTKVESNKENAMATARQLSSRYGKATVWCGYNKIATYKYGMKLN